jgi:hypothetical protein
VAIENRGYVVDEIYKRGWKDRIADMPLVKSKCFVGGRPIDVDIFICESAFQKSLMARRRRDIAEDQEYRLVSPEDMILLKLTTPRFRDVLDAADILYAQGQVDEEYLRTWADQLGVPEKLEEAFQRSRAL